MRPFTPAKQKLSAVILFVYLSACDYTSKESRYPLHFSGATMGTNYTIKASHLPRSVDKEALVAQIKDVLDAVDRQMSTYRADSELSTFNSSRSTQWQTVSEPLFAVLKEAKRVNKITQGAFDVTVGPLVNLWGFGAASTPYQTPASARIEAELKRTGDHHLQLNALTGQIKKDLPTLYLDLSAIAKGYAVDCVGALLEQQSIVNYLVEIGGELRLKGKNADNKRWQIAIEKPVTKTRVIQKIVPLSDISLATSGDYRNYFERDNKRFSHTIDPRTGKPIQHKLASVTLLGDTAMTADAFATAFMVLGAQAGYELAVSNKIAALFIIKTEQGLVEKATPAFNKKLHEAGTKR